MLLSKLASHTHPRSCDDHARIQLVQAAHLARKACLYVRQSSPRQVIETPRARARQYALRERAEALGWSGDQIEVIDCDQAYRYQRCRPSWLSANGQRGQHGSCRPRHRLEVSRLARNCSDWHRLVELCAVTSTLILDQDGSTIRRLQSSDPARPSRAFSRSRGRHSARPAARGVAQKAIRGELKIGLPVGFIYDEPRAGTLASDIQVQRSIRLLFETFRRTGTAGATVQALQRRVAALSSIGGPHTFSGRVLWKPWTCRPSSHLHSPRYAGAFAYGRFDARAKARWEADATCARTHSGTRWCPTRTTATSTGSSSSATSNNSSDRLCLRSGQQARAAARGPALLQAWSCCGVCGGRMTVRYHDRSGACSRLSMHHRTHARTPAPLSDHRGGFVDAPSVNA